jgi:hypothetical protein
MKDYVVYYGGMTIEVLCFEHSERSPIWNVYVSGHKLGTLKSDPGVNPASRQKVTDLVDMSIAAPFGTLTLSESAADTLYELYRLNKMNREQGIPAGEKVGPVPVLVLQLAHIRFLAVWRDARFDDPFVVDINNHALKVVDGIVEKIEKSQGEAFIEKVFGDILSKHNPENN